jgi:5-methylphenazine-1-carboxylate 1-monooxygenase
MKIIIVGAGIGGLVAALRLHRDGIDCEVYEQGEEIRELGVGINVLPYAVEELAGLGLLERLDEAGIRTRELVFAHRLGHEILRRPCDTGPVPQFSIHRGRLQGVLLRAVRERLGAGAVRTGHRLVGFEQDAGGVRADFAGMATPVFGDVLVGADGMHSTVRARLFPVEGPPRWNGLTMWRGATDWPAFAGGRTMVIAGGTPAKLVVYPIGPGRVPGTLLTNWVVCVRTGRAGDPAPAKQEWSALADPSDLYQYLGRFRIPGLDHAGLVIATRESFVFPMCDRDPLPHWSRGRVTLLGDAAHPMYPMGSNGAGQAVLDAVSLAGHLARRPDPVDALHAYQEDRLPATTDMILRNRLGGPEGVIDVVESRAPDGFARLSDVVDPAELEGIVRGYTRAASGAPARLS